MSAAAVVIVSILLCLSGNVQASDTATSSKNFPITTLVNAKWQQTPLYLEIAEYIADESPAVFWEYVKSLTELETSLEEYDTASKQYITAMNIARGHLGALQIPLIKLVVSMHSLTPRVQTHFQIASEILSHGTCETTTFVQVGDNLACTLNELAERLQTATAKSNIETYDFDHIYPGSENNSKTVILYGDIGSKEFASFHNHLAKVALSTDTRYIVRHYVNVKSEKPVRLSGYGVELHLKSTEYKSQDDAHKPTDDGNSSAEEVLETEVQGFDFKVLKGRYPTFSHSLNQLRNSLMQSNEDIVQLKAWEFQDLGLQATAAIAEIQGEESLQILQFTAHNFPMQVRNLITHKVSDELRTEVKHNIESFERNLNIAAPDGALFVNGLFFDADTIDLGALVETLRDETRVLESLHANDIYGQTASALLALDLSKTGNHDFAIDIRDTSIMWINNIESDAQYRRWPASVMDFLRPTFPGMLRNVRKNFFNLVLVVDPIQPQSRSLIKLVESFILHMVPVRLGLVFDDRNADASMADDYLALFCAFNFMTQKKDARAALSMLTDIFVAVDKSQNIRIKHIRNPLKKNIDNLSGSTLDDILGEDSDYDYGRQLAKEFIERLGFADSPQALLNGVPMQQSILSSETDFEEAIFSEIIQQTAVLQKAIYRGDLTDSDSVINYLMNQPHVMQRLNQRILGDESSKYVDFTGIPHNDLSNVHELARLSARDMTATLMNNIRYFSGKHSAEKIGDSELHFLTIWVIGDVEQKESRDLLVNALTFLKTNGGVRVAFIPNTESTNVRNKNNLNRLTWAAMQSLPGVEATDTVLKWLTDVSSNKRNIPADVNDILSSTELHMKMLRVYCQRVFGLRGSERLLISNGKMFGPLRANEQFAAEDFALIDRVHTIQYGDKLRKVLEQNVTDDSHPRITSDTLLKLFAILVPRPSKTRFKIPDDVKNQHSVVELSQKHKDLPYFNITAIVDPASRSAQKLAPILILLRTTVNCYMRVHLIPIAQHSDMPVKNFYRYVVEPEVHFEPNGRLSDGPIAKFTGVPLNPLLTQNLQIPENWLVEAVRSVYDLDNIRLSEIGGPVHSEYELEYLLLEGHCFDAVNGAPPRGLQITLGTQANPTMVDTIVMANLGYFQLKANPGVWELRLREGKSSNIYEINHAEGPNTIHQNSSTKIIISSLRSHVIKLRVSKKPNMQHADLLGDDEETNTGIWNTIANSFGSSGTAVADDDKETINIFSVASGHLYERLLRIMMVSLLKHTKTNVKFWFLKNYLSPQFTDFLPHMAQEYGFKYELVQYKWPRWLHQQTEKQRTIWGYKILFLDVLFPLNVRKIIFVDADAIVRTDLKELWDMELGGSPYAYTPFCDSRKEMEGFRFWKQGYWRSHLMGRRYHISALYVVDLKRFRKIAAGDRLRGQYQALSQDPNSLANLDQDLPNNMIHQVTIKSLPDEWLWCETWCSDSQLKNAKVIDLCNNPLTKEAKLTAAQRIVPEWKDYDLEIKTLMTKIEDHENIEHSHQQTTRSSHKGADDDNEQEAKTTGGTVHNEL